MNNLPLIESNGEYYADSRDVAAAIEREHSKLLRTIRTYCEYLNEAKIGLVDFFVPAEYEDNKGETRPCYFITKKGCDMIANKLTSRKGVLFTAAYVSAFEKMKEQLSSQSTAIQHFPSKATSAGEVASLIKNVRITMERQNSTAVKVAQQTELLLKHFGIPVIADFIEVNKWEQTAFEQEAFA